MKELRTLLDMTIVKIFANQKEDNGMIKGIVKFYGVQTKKVWNNRTKKFEPTNEKEVCLAIEPTNIAQTVLEKAKEFYDGYNRPNWIVEFEKDGKLPKIIYFKTLPEYEPTTISIINNGVLLEESISEHNMRGAEIIMSYNGCYIGHLLLLNEGIPIENPFASMVDNLPFK